MSERDQLPQLAHDALARLGCARDFGVQNLERDLLARAPVSGPMDDAGCSFTDELQQLVVAEDFHGGAATHYTESAALGEGRDRAPQPDPGGISSSRRRRKNLNAAGSLKSPFVRV